MKGELRSYRKREHRSTVQNAIEEGNRGLSEAGIIMKDAKPSNMQEAEELVKKANGVLISTEGTLNRAKKKIKGKKKKIIKKKKK